MWIFTVLHVCLSPLDIWRVQLDFLVTLTSSADNVGRNCGGANPKEELKDTSVPDCFFPLHSAEWFLIKVLWKYDCFQ